MAGKYVLVVDDEAAVRELVSGLVRHCGHHAQTAATGAGALEQVERAHFDLVITDLNMPGMKGDALAAEIKERKPGLPVILITGEYNRIRPPEIDRVLLKPFSLDHLRVAMAELIEPPE